MSVACFCWQIPPRHTFQCCLFSVCLCVCVCSRRIGSKCQWTPSFTGSRPRHGHQEAAHPAERPLLAVKNFHHRQVPEPMKMRSSSQLCVIFFEWWCTLFGRVPVVCHFLWVVVYTLWPSPSCVLLSLTGGVLFGWVLVARRGTPAVNYSVLLQVTWWCYNGWCYYNGLHSLRECCWLYQNILPPTPHLPFFFFFLMVV